MSLNGRPVLPVGIVAAAVLVAAQTAGHLVSVLTGGLHFLDVNQERAVWPVVSAALVLTAACSCRVLAVHADIRWIKVLGALLAFLAADELLMFHEGIGIGAARAFGLPDAWDSALWPLIYLPLLGVVFVLLSMIAQRQVTHAPGRAIRIGLRLLVSAVVVEALSAPLSTATSSSGLPHLLASMIEEGLELGGWGLITVGLVRAAMVARPGVRTTGTGGPMLMVVEQVEDRALDDALARISDLANRLWAVRQAHRPSAGRRAADQDVLRGLRATGPVPDL